MRILQVCAEIYPLLKTGGLADVAGALPAALASHGAEVRVLLPGFGAVLDGLENAQEVATLHPPGAMARVGARLLRGRLAACAAEAWVIDAPAFYLRDGGPYVDAHGQAWDDNDLRFALLGWTAAQLAGASGHALEPHWQPQLVHSHDWHAGLASAYLAAAGGRAAGLPPTVHTVHNLAYQGLFDAGRFAGLGLPAHFLSMHGLEFHGLISFMKAGLYYADHITTVSPGYAREIQSPEQGCGLDGLLRGRSANLSGILNGVDDTVWNPRTDRLLPARYSVDRMAGKAKCKAALRAELGLAADASGPLFCVLSRMTEQKGLHLVLQALPRLLANGGQLALLGSGDAALQESFRAAAVTDPTSVAVRIGYDEALAHRLIAGSDLIVMPSLYEPCGLTQLYGLKYGTLPLVRRVGGLADTVVDTRLDTLDGEATGFVFDAFSADALATAAARAQALFRRPADWKRVQARGMRRPSGWRDAALPYMELYRSLAGVPG